MDNLLKRLDNVESKLIDIEQSLREIRMILDQKITKDCEKMSEHIDFIEHVYSNVKHPLAFVCNKINRLMSSKSLQ